MSDPVTNLEIEDVLSSIRRLVSEGERGKSRAAEAEGADGAAAQPAADDRLVLTPAQRVEPQDDADPTGALAPHETSAELEASLVDPDKPFDPAAIPAETEGAADSGRPAVWGQPEEDAARNAPFEFRAPASEADLPQDPPGEPDERQSLEETVAALEAAVTRQTDEWEPDGSEAEAAADAGMARFPPLDDTSFTPLDEIADAELAAPVSEPDAGNLPAEALGQPISHDPEQVLHQIVGSEQGAPEPEPELEPDAENAEVAPPLFLRHRLPERPDVAPEVEDHGDDLARDAAAEFEPDIDAFLDAEDAVLDEEGLRDLVVQIVREELQGPMGERITRNVRKLVRREIQRALMAQDFD